MSVFMGPFPSGYAGDRRKRMVPGAVRASSAGLPDIPERSEPVLDVAGRDAAPRVVLLVVLLRLGELPGRLDLRRDRPPEATGRLEVILRRHGRSLLLGVVGEDRGAVL